MAYEDFEASEDEGNPIFILSFQKEGQPRQLITNDVNSYGPEEMDREPPLFSGETITATPMKVGSVSSGDEVAASRVEFEFPLSLEFSKQFLGAYVSPVVTVVVWRFHKDDPEDLAVYWRGRVVESKYRGDNKLVLTCENLFTTLQKTGLRAKYQKTCRHILYQRGCNLNYDAWKTQTTILSYDGGVNLRIALNAENDYYRGGILQFGNEYGFILSQTGQNLTLHTAVRGLEPGQIIFVAPGCDLTIRTCLHKFDNLMNHGGFPHIPSESPFGGDAIKIIGGGAR